MITLSVNHLQMKWTINCFSDMSHMSLVNAIAYSVIAMVSVVQFEIIYVQRSLRQGIVRCRGKMLLLHGVGFAVFCVACIHFARSVVTE